MSLISDTALWKFPHEKSEGSLMSSHVKNLEVLLLFLHNLESLNLTEGEWEVGRNKICVYINIHLLFGKLTYRESLATRWRHKDSVRRELPLLEQCVHVGDTVFQDLIFSSVVSVNLHCNQLSGNGIGWKRFRRCASHIRWMLFI